MKETINHLISSVYSQSTNSLTLTENIFYWPGQVLTCIFAILWTCNMKECIQSNAKGCYETLFAKEKELFDKLLEISMTSNLSKKDTIILNNLLLQKLHHVSITERFKEKPPCGSNDFQWLSQLRYEYSDSNLTIQSLTHSIEYGYEYLGNVKSLVFTPLTERCYQTFFLALNYHLGGWLSGPACSGKTETVKEFAKCLAKYMIVFNCSDTVQHAVLSNFFKVSF